MLNKIFIISLITLSFMLSGCNSDSEGESRLETQVMLDKRNYEGVISKLANRDIKTQEDNLALGAAYMGRAGLSLSDLVKVVSKSGDNENAFGSFISSIEDATKDSKSPLTDLNKATQHYENVVGDKCTDGTTLSDSESDLCIFKGLTQIMGTATTISYIANDIGKVFNSDGEVDNKLQASACAMQYAIDGSTGTNCNVKELSEVTFASGLTYRELEVTVNEEKFEYLLSGISTVITKGYCRTDDFTTRVENKTSVEDNNNFHVCPINEDANASELTTGAIIADALNKGIDSVGVAANDDMQEDINEFKSEVLASSGKSGSDTITEEDIVNYLNEQNK